MAEDTVEGLITNVLNLEEAASSLDLSAPELPELSELFELSAITDIASLPTDIINPDLLAGVMPSEPICPKIPGVFFLSPEDLLGELASQVSSAASRQANVLAKAAIDVAAQVEANLAAEFDKVSEGFTELEAVLEAIKSGAIDISPLGIDVLLLPGAALAAAFPGFKKALECLEGELGSAEKAFNAKAGKLSEGLAEGNGLSATAADEAITNSSEDAIDETGNKIKKQKTISVKDALSAIKGTTKTAVPQSDSPLSAYQYVSRLL
ncbi:MAG TPA: hypothetical protein EYQ26_14405 [Rhodospirillales bacterium]|nr:hypothetical protein [Rhodospirillales bacterium]